MLYLNVINMDALINLIHHIRKNKIKNLKIFHYGVIRPQSKMGQLYRSLYEQSDRINNQEIARSLGFRSSTDPIYRNLKNDLKNRLVNTLLLIEPGEKEADPMRKAYMSCWKEWAATKILFARQAHPAGIDLARKVLSRAKKYGFTEMALHSSKCLRLYYSEQAPDPKKYAEYDRLAKHYQELYSWENQAENEYLDLMILFDRSADHKSDVARQAFSAFAKLKPALQQYTSCRLIRLAKSIQMTGHLHRQEHGEVIRVCDEALELLLDNEFAPRESLAVFLYQKLQAQIRLREFQAGEYTALQTNELAVFGSNFWFKTQELSIMLALHSRAYTQADQILARVKAHKNFFQQEPETQEKWIILEGYLAFLKSTGKIAAPGGAIRNKKFRVSRLINAVPQHTKEKRGMNIPILILQVLFTISRHQYQKAIDRMEAIEKYCFRYLRKDETFRSNCFLKMLLLVPAHGFQRQLVERHAAPLFQQLCEMPLSQSPQDLGIEIIPYEDLWPMVLDTLGHRHYRRHDHKGRKTNP